MCHNDTSLEDEQLVQSAQTIKDGSQADQTGFAVCVTLLSDTDNPSAIR